MAATSPGIEQHSAPAARNAAFVSQASEAIRLLRGAVADLMPAGTRTASDLKRLLSIDYRLAWQVHKVVHTHDLLSAGAYVPNRPSFTRFLAAASASTGRAPKARIDAASRAFDAFEEVVATHAGDRVTFDSMLSSAGSSSAEATDLLHRRTAFVANSHLWGVQVRTHLLCHLFHPGRQPGTMDHAQLRGPIGLRRLRPDAPYRVSGSRDPATLPTPQRIARDPIDPRGVLPEGTSVLTDFSSAPLPPLTTERTHDGWIETRLAGTGVGSTSEFSVIVGDVLRDIPSPMIDPPRIIRLRYHVLRPLEVLMFDVLMHDGLFHLSPPVLSVYANPTDCEASPHDPVGSAERLPLRATVQKLGAGPSVIYSPDVPHYADLLRYATSSLNWNAERFEVWRLRIAYPVMHSVVQVLFDLDAG